MIQLNSKKTKQSDFQVGRIPEQTFIQRRPTGGQQAQENVFDISNYHGNAN